MQCTCAFYYCHLWLAWLCHIFPYYLIKGNIYWVIEHEMWILIFSKALSETFLVLRRLLWDRVKNVYWSASCKVSAQWNLNFLNRFSKNTQISNFMKIRPVGAQFFFADGRADRRTESEKDRTKLIVAFHYFPNATKSALVMRSFYLHFTPADVTVKQTTHRSIRACRPLKSLFKCDWSSSAVFSTHLT